MLIRCDVGKEQLLTHN